MTTEEALKEFARWAVREGCWDGGTLEGGDIQDKAESLGLLVRVKYDPAVHGESGAVFDFVDIEPGDDWVIFCDDLKEKP